MCNLQIILVSDLGKNLAIQFVYTWGCMDRYNAKHVFHQTYVRASSLRQARSAVIYIIITMYTVARSGIAIGGSMETCPGYPGE